MTPAKSKKKRKLVIFIANPACPVARATPTTKNQTSAILVNNLPDMYNSIIAKFDFILNRGNDLTEFFWPILYWTKEQILKHHQIPLWNNFHLSGTPLVSDPQAPIFYPLNILALFLPLDLFYLISFILHFIFGAIGMYLTSKTAFKFSKSTSLILAFLWALTPKFFASLEAGHVGLVYSFAWIPFIILFSLKRRIVLLSMSLSLLYFSHLPTFLIVGIGTALILLWKKFFLPLIIVGVLTFGLTAVSLVPQIKFQKYSTRYLLIHDKDIYPKWTSKIEAVKAIFIPNMETEKAISLGIIPAFLAVSGFLKLRKKQKILVAAGTFAIGLIMLNNASPIYPWLLKQNWYLLLRVSTRFWLLILPLIIYLIGKAVDKNKFFYFLSILGILESIYWGTIYLQKPIKKNPNLAPREVYEYLAKDKSLFRVYCLNRCLSQKEAAIYNLELLGGYSTIQQKNFNQQAWQLTGAYWDYYTLSIPPFAADTSHPDIKSLGEYNVKYIIAPNELKTENLKLRTKIQNFYIYESNLSVPRNYEIYTPNFIRVHVPSSYFLHHTSYIIPEIYSPGWRAYLNGIEEVPVQETPNSLRAVTIKPETKFVDFKFKPFRFSI